MPSYDENSSDAVVHIVLLVISTALDSVAVPNRLKTSIVEACHYQAQLFASGANQDDE